MNRMEKIRRIVIVVISISLISGSFIGGVYLGYNNKPSIQNITTLFNKEEDKPVEVDFSPFWKSWDVIQSKYVSKEKLNNQDMVWGAIKGLVGSTGDPYSTFFPPEQNKIFQEDIRGNFGGIGIEIGIRNNILTVISPLKNTPAYKASLKTNDKILKINDTSTENLSVEEAVTLIRGEIGTKVKLTIFREEKKEPFEVTIVRDVINVPTIDTETKPGGIFVIKLYNFGAQSTETFRKALRSFIESGNDKLIIDLRGNAGGYLDASVDIASWFLPAGETVVIEKSGSGEENVFRSRGYDIFKNLPLVVLVNNGSASAAEILAGALQDHGLTKLVGEKTFGKGSVQELVTITTNPETSLKITVAKWLTPNGRSISDNGLDPDIKVEMKDEDVEKGKDPQMDKAIEILNKK
ncbi:MAG: S41 family peptidase [Patescibacteria group bacterium]